jgi:hypothetical protein
MLGLGFGLPRHRAPVVHVSLQGRTRCLGFADELQVPDIFTAIVPKAPVASVKAPIAPPVIQAGASRATRRSATVGATSSLGVVMPTA